MIRRRHDPSADLHAEPHLFETAPSLDSVEVRAEVDFTLPPLVFLRELTFSFRAEDSTAKQTKSTSRSKGRERNRDEHHSQDPAFFAGVKVYPKISPAQGPTEDHLCQEAPLINIHEGRARVNSPLEQGRSIKSLSTLLKDRRNHTDAKLGKEDSASSLVTTECLSRTTTTISNHGSVRPTLAKSKTFSSLSRHEKPSLTPRRINAHHSFVLSKAETPVMDHFVIVGRSVPGRDRNTERRHHHLVEDPLMSDDDDENMAGTPAPPPPPSPDSVFPPLRLPSLSDKHYAISTKVKVR